VSFYHNEEVKKDGRPDITLSNNAIMNGFFENKKIELEAALSRLPDSSDIILWSKVKTFSTMSTRGSRYRGVSKNGNKWQV